MNERKTSSSPIYSGARRLLSPGGGLYELVQRMYRSHLTWDEFLAMDLPPEMTPLETWDLLERAGRSSGIDLPIPDLAGNEYWYLRTHEIADAVCRLQCLCRADSALYRRLTATEGRRVLVRLRIDETIAAALLDGLDISSQEAYALLQLDRKPRNSTEQIVRNTLDAIDRLDDLAAEPFSPELFEHLRQMLLERVPFGSWHATQPRRGLLPSDYTDDEVRAAGDQQLRYISDYANHLTGDRHDHPVLRALLLPDVIRFYRPLPNMNGQVGRLAFRLYTIKMGLPVLGMLPLSRIKLAWEEGSLTSPLVTLQPKEYFDAHEHFGSDLTGYTTLTVRLALIGLAELEERLRRLEERDEELRVLLQRDPSLNHRQRSILGRALRNPDAEFRIAYHKTTHNVVYATARADLMDLVERGYLRMETRGRAFVFVPESGLRHRIEDAGRQDVCPLDPLDDFGE